MEEELRKAGLTGNEAKVYLELLRRGSISANELSKKVSMDRTLTYQILNNLVEKGLVSHIIKEHKKYFEVTDPENLFRVVEEQKELIGALIPKLKKIEKVSEIKQEAKVYEGKEGLKTFYRELLESRDKDICIFGATGKSYDALKYQMPSMAKRAQKFGIKGRMITSPKFKGHEMTKLKSIKTKYLKEVESPATTIIYGDKVSIHVLTDKPVVIIIKNKEIAKSYKSYFETLWKIARVK